MRRGTWRDGLRPILRVVDGLLMVLLPGATMFAGYALGLWLFPRSDTAQLVAAGAGVVPGAVLYLYWRLWMHRVLAETEGNQP